MNKHNPMSDTVAVEGQVSVGVTRILEAFGSVMGNVHELEQRLHRAILPEADEGCERKTAEGVPFSRSPLAISLHDHADDLYKLSDRLRGLIQNIDL